MKIASFLLSAGRQHFLEEALASLRMQTKKGLESFLIKDFSSSFNKNLDLTDIKILETPDAIRGRGWTYAFEFALSQVPQWADYFFVMHDDDILEPNYIEKMQDAAIHYSNANVVSCSLTHINKNGDILPLQPFQFPETELATARDVAFLYLDRCIPFPSCFYKNKKNLLHKEIEHDLGSFADGLFLARYTGENSAVILKDSLYRYRHHASQVSWNPPRVLEKQFFERLEKVIPSKIDKAFFRRKILVREFHERYSVSRQKKESLKFLNWLFSHSFREIFYLLRQPKFIFKTSKSLMRYLFEKTSPIYF